jgi:excisionase family DNA binding protein
MRPGGSGSWSECPYLTVREVAAKLSVCTATIYELCASGSLAHVRVLNAIRVAPEGLERFLAARSKVGPDKTGAEGE